MLADELLKGAIDLHVHGYPEVSFDVRTRVEDFEIASLAQESGMGGFALKSHVWPTVGKVYYLKKKFPKLHIISSITLNITAGGLNPISVESAAKQGAKIIFMPTWSAANDLRRGGFSTYMKKYLKRTNNLDPSNGLTLMAENGKLRSEVKEIISIAKEYSLAIATGHISPEESFLIADEANSLGGIPVIFSHPDSKSVGGTSDDIKVMIKKGAYVEICALGMMPAFQRVVPGEVCQLINELGADNFILTTDFFFDWAPPPPEMLRMVIGTLLINGLNQEQIRKMVDTNPINILSI
jgi:hypothetical protein